MIFAKKVIKELEQENNSLFRSFLPNSNYNFKFEEVKNFKKFNTIIIIGMGGSILGAKAIYSFLKHKTKKEFIFIDNLDQGLIKKIKTDILKKFNIKLKLEIKLLGFDEGIYESN